MVMLLAVMTTVAAGRSLARCCMVRPPRSNVVGAEQQLILMHRSTNESESACMTASDAGMLDEDALLVLCDVAGGSVEGVDWAEGRS